MTVIGVTGAHSHADKRGLAANLAAFAAAREPEPTVVVIDADPHDADVGKRLAIDGPDMQRVCSLSDGVSGGALLAVAARVAWPRLRVVPISPGHTLDSTSVTRLRSVLARLRVAADVVVVDCPVAEPPLRRSPATSLLGTLDVLVLAVTPDRTSVAAAHRFLDRVPHAIERGWLDPNVAVRVALTGDEGSTTLDPFDCADSLGASCSVITTVPQWWGRVPPNFGFGATLQIPEIDRGLAVLVDGTGVAATMRRPALTALPRRVAN